MCLRFKAERRYFLSCMYVVLYLARSFYYLILSLYLTLDTKFTSIRKAGFAYW